MVSGPASIPLVDPRRSPCSSCFHHRRDRARAGRRMASGRGSSCRFQSRVPRAETTVAEDDEQPGAGVIHQSTTRAGIDVSPPSGGSARRTEAGHARGLPSGALVVRPSWRAESAPRLRPTLLDLRRRPRPALAGDALVRPSCTKHFGPCTTDDGAGDVRGRSLRQEAATGATYGVRSSGVGP